MASWTVEESYADCVRHQAQWERIQGLNYAEAQAEGVRKCTPCYDSDKQILKQYITNEPQIKYGAGGHVVGTIGEEKAIAARMQEKPLFAGGVGSDKPGLKLGLGGIGLLFIFAIGYLIFGRSNK